MSDAFHHNRKRLHPAEKAAAPPGSAFFPQPYEKQNKSVTLNSDELDKLIEYIQDYYAPLNIGMKEFISVDEDAAKLFSKIRSLNISDDEVVDKLISTGILTDNLSVAITAAERKMAITEFENAIALEKSESYWQTWFEKNKWVLGDVCSK